jgi:aerobic-type carbon monoxide dehydrogenase small subunit (CoxS/CutS family)
MISLSVNGGRQEVDASPDETLLSVLRDRLDLTGTKYGCGEGQCGACTVLLDGRPVRSCRTPVGSVGARQITTIEGLEKNGQLHPVQEAFLEKEAFQCAYCTSGMIMSAAALLSANPNPTDNQIVHSLNGNVCRCGTYPRIVAAVRYAASMQKGSR